MEVRLPDELLDDMLGQMMERKRRLGVFSTITQDYDTLHRRFRELQVRCAQLDKEAHELRDENHTLRSSLDNQHQMDAAEVAAIQEENAVLVREKAGYLQELHDTSNKLGTTHAQLAEMQKVHQQAASRVQELEKEVQMLMGQKTQLQQACELAAAEAAERLQAKDQAQERLQVLEMERWELESRLVEEKDKVVKMMEVLELERQELAVAQRECRTTLERASSKPSSAARGMAGMMGIMRRSVEPRRSVSGSGCASGDGDAAPADAADGRARVELPDACALKTLAHEGGCNSVAFSRSGQQVVTCGMDNTAKVYSASCPGEAMLVLRGMMAAVSSARFTTDGASVVAGGADKSVRVWNTATGQLRHTMNGSAKVNAVDAHPLDVHRAVSCSEDRMLGIWDLTRGIIHQSTLCTSKIFSLCYTNDGMLIVTGHFDRTVRVWDARSSKKVAEVPEVHTQAITSVVCGARDPRLVLTCGKDHLLKLVDVHGREVKRSFRDPAFSVPVQSCQPSVSPEDAYLAAGSSTGQVLVWDAQHCSVEKRLSGHDAPVAACSWSSTAMPDSAFLASVDRHGMLLLWGRTA